MENFMTTKINDIMPFSFLESNTTDPEEFAQILETEMAETQKKVRELKRKNDKTIEENIAEIQKKFKKNQNLYETFDIGKFETKLRVDLLFFEHLCQNLPEIPKMENLISQYYATVRDLFESINLKPEMHKMLKSSLLVESHDDQQKQFAKILSEHINNNYYRFSLEKRKEMYLSESKEYTSDLIQRGLETEEAIKLGVKACLIESLIANIAIPKFVQRRIKTLCEDADYGKVFDQEKLKQLWESFNKQTKNLAKIFSAAI